MVLSGVPMLLAVIYLSVVFGTYKKFKINGIRFKGISKYLFILVPLFVLGFHIFWSIKSLIVKRDFKFAIYLLKLSIIKYPIAIGLIIEIMLESAAYNISKNVISIRKKKNRSRAINRKAPVDLKHIDMDKQRNIIEEYMKSIHSTAHLAS